MRSARHREDLTPESRLKLYETLDWLLGVIAEIDSGVRYAEENSSTWGYEYEQPLGSKQFLSIIREWPLLRRLMPDLRHLSHEGHPVIASCREAADDIRIARSVLMHSTEFRTQHGTGLGEMILTVRFADDALVVAEQSVADETSGQPLSSNESRVPYSEFSSTSGVGVKVHFPTAVYADIAALVGRYCKAIVPCDVCGARVHQFNLPGDGLHIEHWSCWGHDEAITTTPAV